SFSDLLYGAWGDIRVKIVYAPIPLPVLHPYGLWEGIRANKAHPGRGCAKRMEQGFVCGPQSRGQELGQHDVGTVVDVGEPVGAGKGEGLLIERRGAEEFQGEREKTREGLVGFGLTEAFLRWATTPTLKERVDDFDGQMWGTHEALACLDTGSQECLGTVCVFFGQHPFDGDTGIDHHGGGSHRRVARSSRACRIKGQEADRG